MTTTDEVRWTMLRAALLVVGKPPETFNLGLGLNDVEVDVLGPVAGDDRLLGMLAVARVELDAGPVAGETFALPHEARERAESALEN